MTIRKKKFHLSREVIYSPFYHMLCLYFHTLELGQHVENAGCCSPQIITYGQKNTNEKAR